MEGAAGVGPNGGSEVGMGGVMSEAQRPPVQLDLLPLAPPLRALHSHLILSTCLTQYGNGKCCDGEARTSVSVNQKLIDDDAHALVSSPNSTVSSFQMAVDFSVHPGGRGGRGSSHASSHGKKLRLCKEQSAYLDECLKEHTSTILYPKQKLALAWQLNLRPRQIEVWLQNRKVRTKLKQTEAEYKYMKRCCETLTEENQRIQKEIQELRDLKVAHPFYMQLPLPLPPTLSMCPSCQRVATNDNENPLKSFLRFLPPQ